MIQSTKFSFTIWTPKSPSGRWNFWLHLHCFAVPAWVEFLENTKYYFLSEFVTFFLKQFAYIPQALPLDNSTSPAIKNQTFGSKLNNLNDSPPMVWIGTYIIINEHQYSMLQLGRLSIRAPFWHRCPACRQTRRPLSPTAQLIWQPPCPFQYNTSTLIKRHSSRLAACSHRWQLGTAVLVTIVPEPSSFRPFRILSSTPVVWPMIRKRMRPNISATVCPILLGALLTGCSAGIQVGQSVSYI